MAEYLASRDLQQDAAGGTEIFTADGIWEGTGEFAHLLGVHQGRAALEQRALASQQRLPFSTHFLANESIVVDGDRAVGTWTFLQCGVSDGQALWIAGRYRNDFVRQGGRWKIQHLRVADIFVAPYTEGWAPYLAAKLGAEPPPTSHRAASTTAATERRGRP
jgi:hypothetical protein